MGDFNCNILSPSLTTRTLITIMLDYQLTQVISTPTRVSNHSQTIIDLCFTSSPQSFSSSGTIPLTASDHLMIYITRQHKIHNHIPKIQKVRSFKNCDPTFLSEDLCSAPWEVIETFDSLDDKWDYWKTLFLGIVDKHAPLINVRNKPQTLKWISGDIR